MNMMINIAAAMMNTRFGELAQQEGCPFASAHLQNVPLTNTCDALELQVVARGDAIAEAFTSAYGELERVRRFGFTEEELEQVRTGILRGGKYAYETAGDRENGMLVWECTNSLTSCNVTCFININCVTAHLCCGDIKGVFFT